MLYVVCVCVCACRQLEMMNSYPAELLAALGFPPDALQTELLKHKTLARLKVRDECVCVCRNGCGVCA